MFNHTAQHTDAIDSNANLQGASELIIRLPPLILRLLESSQHRNIVQVCHGAIASVLQLPDLCLAVDSSIGYTFLKCFYSDNNLLFLSIFCLETASAFWLRPISKPLLMQFSFYRIARLITLSPRRCISCLWTS